MCGVITLVSCAIVVVNVQVYFSLFETVLRVFNFLDFPPLMLFWTLIILKLCLTLFVKSDQKKRYQVVCERKSI